MLAEGRIAGALLLLPLEEPVEQVEPALQVQHQNGCALDDRSYSTCLDALVRTSFGFDLRYG